MSTNTDTPQLAVPRYRRRRSVGALQIKNLVESHEDPEKPIELVFMDDRYLPIPVSLDFCARHDVHPGGYYVFYPNDTFAFIDRDDFEAEFQAVT